METKTFKTNIKCSGCIEKVTPYLNQRVGEGLWTVDVTDPDKKLTVEAPIEGAVVIQAVTEAGYKAEQLK
ncbi:MAG: hypothetical protein J0H92_05035 [Sphingobacteriales bacterium]|jgi:copper chaperone CopZ|nr:hypothetical protein [Sphingobacteriales bacterium]NCT74699.1 heavy metal transport/detoxification protein [Chitinophagaceae bacterium]OJW32278.1 MAG: heavy metal transport/detoxification protein [Sphingobacteriales bacterium 46-32]